MLESNPVNPVPDLFDKLRGLPFWIEDRQDHLGKGDQCCFNHVLGLPSKADGIEQPIYPYETNIIKQTETHRRIFVLKSRGAGLTELLLRYILYRAISLNESGNYLFLSGPNWELSRTLLRRVRNMLAKHGWYTEERESILTLPLGARLQSYPSQKASVFRSLTDVRFLLADEFCFFGNESNVRAVIDAYVAKNENTQIALISTPSSPYGLCPDLEKEIDSLYYKIRLPYNDLPIYSTEEIRLAKKSPSFRREFELYYGFGQGNAFVGEQIDNCISKYDCNPADKDNVVINIDCDPGFGSSKFALVATAIIDGKLVVLDAQEFTKANFQDCVSITHELMTSKYGFTRGKDNIRVLADSSNPSFVRAVKLEIGENEEYEKVREYSRHNKIPLSSLMVVVPISFGEDGRNMLVNLAALLSDGMISINPQFADLIMQLRIAKVKETTGNLDKDQDTLDLVDAMRLSCFNVDYRGGGH